MTGLRLARVQVLAVVGATGGMGLAVACRLGFDLPIAGRVLVIAGFTAGLLAGVGSGLFIDVAMRLLYRRFRFDRGFKLLPVATLDATPTAALRDSPVTLV